MPEQTIEEAFSPLAVRLWDFESKKYLGQYIPLLEKEEQRFSKYNKIIFEVGQSLQTVSPNETKNLIDSYQERIQRIISELKPLAYFIKCEIDEDDGCKITDRKQKLYESHIQNQMMEKWKEELEYYIKELKNMQRLWHSNEPSSKKQKIENSIEVQPEKQLLGTIYMVLAGLNEDELEYLIYHDDYSNIKERRRIAKALNDLSSGIKNIPILNFQWNSGPVYYIFKLLMKYNKRLILTEVEEGNKILIKEKAFIANNCYAGASRFEINPRNGHLKNKIDIIFKEHLM